VVNFETLAGGNGKSSKRGRDSEAGDHNRDGVLPSNKKGRQEGVGEAAVGSQAERGSGGARAESGTHGATPAAEASSPTRAAAGVGAREREAAASAAPLEQQGHSLVGLRICRIFAGYSVPFQGEVRAFKPALPTAEASALPGAAALHGLWHVRHLDGDEEV
jgi:hypothetical protein